MEYRYTHKNLPKNQSHISQAEQGQQLLNDIYMDLFLKHVHGEKSVELLKEEIDQALDNHDKKLFMTLTDELQQLQLFLSE